MPPTRSLSRRDASALAVAGAVALHLLAQVGMLVIRPDWSIAAFRGYFPIDQLSYMAIVSTAAHGQFAPVEPFTETGTIYYPRMYYVLLGAVAHALSLPPVVAWNIGGLVLQCLLVGVLAVVCILLAGRPWVGLLAAAPLMLGTFSTFLGNDWATHLDAHAVLWGPFAVLFTLNAEAAGLCLGAIALLLVLLAAVRFTGRAQRIALFAVASAAIGALANVQTYSFLSVTYVAAYGTAAYSVAYARRWWPLVASAVAIGVVYLAGPVIASAASPLVALVFGLLPAVPGLVLLLVRTRGLAAAFAAVAALAASPSLLATASGLASGDPFLVYRVASSMLLGVPWYAGLAAATVLLVPLALVLAAGIHRRNALWTGYPVGIASAWAVSSTNDVWGANQEPYRFWIDCFLLTAVTLLPIAVSVFGDYWGAGVEPRRVAAAGLVAVAVLALVSGIDWLRFAYAQNHVELIRYDSERDSAIGEAASAATDGLLLTDTCIDPQSVKVITGQPVAYANKGMAWPAEYEAVFALMDDRVDRVLRLDRVEAADSPWLITDSTCVDGWSERYAAHLTQERVVPYDGGTITLWRVRP